VNSEQAQRPVPPVANDAAGAKVPADDQGSCLEFLLAQRHMSNAAVLAGLVAVIGIAFSLFHLYAAYFGQGESYLHNTIHVALVMVLCFILKPLGRSTRHALQPAGYSRRRSWGRWPPSWPSSWGFATGTW